MGYNSHSPELGDIALSDDAIGFFKSYYTRDEGGRERHYIEGPLLDSRIRIADPNGDHIHGLHPVDALLQQRMEENAPIEAGDMLYVTRYAVHKGFKRMAPKRVALKDRHGDEEEQIRFDNHRRPSWRKGFRTEILARAFAEERFHERHDDSMMGVDLRCAVKAAQPAIADEMMDSSPYIYPDGMFDEAHALHQAIKGNWTRLQTILAPGQKRAPSDMLWEEVKNHLPERVVEKALKQRARELGKKMNELEEADYADIHPFVNGGGLPWLPEMNFDHHSSHANRLYYGEELDTDWASLRDHYKAEAEIFGMGVLVGYYLRQMAREEEGGFYSEHLPEVQRVDDPRKVVSKLVDELAIDKEAYRYRWMYEGHAAYPVPQALEDGKKARELVEALAERMLGEHPRKNMTYMDYVRSLQAEQDWYSASFYEKSDRYSASYGGMDVFLNGVHAGISWSRKGTRLHPDAELQGEEEVEDNIPHKGMTFYDFSRIVDFKFRKRLTDLYHMKPFVSLAESRANSQDGVRHEQERGRRDRPDVEWGTWHYHGPAANGMHPMMLDAYVESARIRSGLERDAWKEMKRQAEKAGRDPDDHDRMLAMESIYEGNNRVARTVK